MTERTEYVEDGGLWEFGWEVRYDASGIPSGTDPEPLCPHCHSRQSYTRWVLPQWTKAKADDPDWRAKWGEEETTYSWTCPRVVVAYNEAGHSSTGICLDCILDWVKQTG